MINVGGNRWAMALALLAAIGLSGCPGDNAAPPSQGTTITGSVTAPNGQLAKAEPGLLQWFASLFVSESHAQGASGLQPVAGQRILVFQIDKDGNPVTSASNTTGIIAQTTTGASGSFSVNLPAGTSLASNIIVQASGSTTPTPVCNQANQANCSANQNQTLNCPAVGTTLNINPAAELATRQILSRIAQPGGALGNYTNAEIGAFVTLVQTTVASDPTLIAGNLNDTLTNIGNRVQGLIDDVLPGLENPGQTDPTAVAGIYNFVGFQAEAQSTGTLRRAVEFGTVVLNSNGTFTVASQQQGAQLTESCSASCSRTFGQSAINQTDTDSGTYVRTGNGRIIFSFPPPDAGSIVAFSNPSGNIVIVPFESGEGFAIAVKQGSGLSNATAQGTFNWVEFSSGLRSAQAETGSSWQGPLQSFTGSGTAAFANNDVTIIGNVSGMGQQLTCTLTGTGCNLVAALGQQAENFNFPSPFSISPTGTLTITDTDPQTAGNQTGIGEVSADGNYAIFPTPETNGGSLVVATRQATGLNNASLNGTYNLIAFGDILTNQGDILTVLSLGTCRPDSIKKMGFQAINTVKRRTESCPSSGACSISSAPASDATTFNENRDYTLAANGALTITSPGLGQLTGFVSPDASFLFLTNAVDNDVPTTGPLNGITNSRRFIAVAVKQS